MKVAKKILGAIFIVCMCVIVSDNLHINEKREEQDHVSKVRFEGIGDVSESTNKEVVEKINNSEVTKLIIELDNEYDEQVERPQCNDITLEEVQEIIMEQRRNVKEHYSKTNLEITQELDLSGLDVTYKVDSYAPYVFAEFNEEITEHDIEEIYKLSEEEQINTIYVRCDDTEREELSRATSAIEATEISKNSATNGSGVVIGLLETGIVDETNERFKNVDLTVRKEWWYDETVTEHATQVALCALAVAPESSILSVQKHGEPSGEIEWMLDNGVNIINISMSVGDKSDYGYYTSQSAYCDYIARHNWVVFTCSAGNRGKSDALVTPINGYNTITVGACYRLGRLSETSSYEEKFQINFPNIVAPGVNISIPTFSDSVSGTSFSAPLTAGTVAVLMQNTPNLTYFPERVLAIIMVSAERVAGYEIKSGFDDKIGTGKLNLNNALKTVNNVVSFSNNTNKVGTYISSKTLYLKAGQKIRVAFVSFVNNSSEEDMSTNLVTDYDLHLCGPNQDIKASSITLYNNEFIDYTVKTPGYYTIKIKQFSAKKTSMTDYCAYAYFVE